MNELQSYVDSLPSMLLEEEKKKLVKQWKIDNKWGEEKPEPVGTGTVLKSEDITYGGEAVKEVIEAVKTDGDAAGAGHQGKTRGALLCQPNEGCQEGAKDTGPCRDRKEHRNIGPCRGQTRRSHAQCGGQRSGSYCSAEKVVWSKDYDFFQEGCLIWRQNGRKLNRFHRRRGFE